LRIVYLNPCGELGGAETSLREVLAGIRSAQPDWRLWLVLGEDGPLADIARELGVEVIVAPFPRQLSRLGDAAGGGLANLRSLLGAAPGTAKYARGLTRLLKDLKPDVVHTNGFKMHLLGARCSPPEAALIWHIHDYVGSRRIMSRLLSLVSKRCRAAIANSHNVAADIKSLMPRLDVVTIYNAVDLGRFSPEGAQLDLAALSGLEPAHPGAIRVGLVGTFARWKGHKVFLEALARLAGQNNVRGYIIGGPIYQTAGSQWSMSELREEASRLGLASQVGFTGFVADTAEAMRSLDIVVHASTKPEPFGMVIIEGMACGRAVLASSAGGASELFTDGVDALGHASGDARMLASRIMLLASDGDLRRRLGMEGRRTAQRVYHRRRLVSELLGLYMQCSQNIVRPRVETVTAKVGASG
jgi:glycosyltransferase involved in cell wall biosynthesis